MFTDEQKTELGKKLNPAHVQKPKGQFGPKGDYIEGWHAITEANRIFGFDGWSYRINDLKQCGQTYENNKGNSIVSYIASVTVTIIDQQHEEGQPLERQDIGYGSGASKHVGDAHEGATKEAVTDALKRALRTFGNQFGLALYDKTQSNVGIDIEPIDMSEYEAGVSDIVEELGTVDEVREYVKDAILKWQQQGLNKEQRAKLIDITKQRTVAIEAANNTTLMAG